MNLLEITFQNMSELVGRYGLHFLQYLRWRAILAEGTAFLVMSTKRDLIDTKEAKSKILCYYLNEFIVSVLLLQIYSCTRMFSHFVLGMIRTVQYFQGKTFLTTVMFIFFSIKKYEELEKTIVKTLTSKMKLPSILK